MVNTRLGRERRHVSTFSLSFLDIMACGFGAVTLLFLILKHDASTALDSDSTMNAEARWLTEDIRIGQLELVELRNSLDSMGNRILDARGQSERALDDLNQRKLELNAQVDPEEQVALLRKQVEELKNETALLQDAGSGDNTRKFLGDGDRQYLTGLKLGGRRVLILVDSSASMLANKIVNVIRRRNMADSIKRKSAKWQRAVRTVEWLVAQLPDDSRYQIYTFNTKASALLPNTAGQWLDASDAATLDEGIEQLQRTIPENGTSLYHAFQTTNQFSLRPDNVFVITDGLPTQGQSAPKKSTVSSQARSSLFNEAVKVLAKGVPVNVILFPMEGDAAAAALFWTLAVNSRGAFLSPARDWP